MKILSTSKTDLNKIDIEVMDDDDNPETEDK